MIHSYFKDCFLTTTKKSFSLSRERCFMCMYLPVRSFTEVKGIVRVLCVYCPCIVRE